MEWYGIIIVVDILLQGVEEVLGFGEVLKRLRGHQNISQRELGERIGLDFTYISKIENGSMPPPSEEKLILMAEIFRVNVYDFILLAGRIPTKFEILIKNNVEVQKYLENLIEEREGK